MDVANVHLPLVLPPKNESAPTGFLGWHALWGAYAVATTTASTVNCVVNCTAHVLKIQHINNYKRLQGICNFWGRMNPNEYSYDITFKLLLSVK